MSFTRAQIAASPNLLLIDGAVYDITSFARAHPGGKVIHSYAARDATDAYHAFHKGPRPDARLASLRVGTLATKDTSTGSSTRTDKDAARVAAFRQLKVQAEAAGLFIPRGSFFAGHLAGILLLEGLGLWASASAAASAAASSSAIGWAGWFGVAAVALGLAQIQAGWLQHDAGHLAMFEDPATNHLAHKAIMLGLKGASPSWWLRRHNAHHAKSNHLGSDPDLANDPVFLFSEVQVDAGRGWAGTWAQGWYWWALGPPLLTTLVFFVTNIMYCVKRALWGELALGLLFIPRFLACHTIGTGGSLASAVALYFAMRLVESLIFTWITAMSHFPMAIVDGNAPDAAAASWPHVQFAATQNLSSSLWHDWISGHLNYQIEHHLFPTMPRHSYPLIAPAVRAYAAQHGLDYRVTPFATAARQIIHTLHRVAGYKHTR